MLLEELHFKLQQSLNPPQAVPWGNGNTEKVGFARLRNRAAGDIATWAIQLLPALCQHLEQISEFFHAIIAENDGLRDITIFQAVPGTQLAMSLYLSLLSIIADILGWAGFAEASRRYEEVLKFLSLAPIQLTFLLFTGLFCNRL